MKLIRTEDGLDTLLSSEYNETYHSKHGVLQEAQHVFLNGTGISEKLKSEKKISILEIGFGTGFNFFLTTDAALKNDTKMVYYAVENNLLDYEEFIRLNHNNLFSKNPIWLNFLSWRKYSTNIKPGIYKIVLRNIKLILILSDALQIDLPKNRFNAIYHDAFSPDVNPQLWTPAFFKKIIQAMKPGAKLSTYSAKGNVKRTLQEAGFIVEKLPGPKGKREMLVATRE